jgi:hypothetical protein
MTCKEVEQEIDLYVADECSPEVREKLEAHIASCRDCKELEQRTRRFLEGLEKDLLFLRLKEMGQQKVRQRIMKRETLRSVYWKAGLAAAGVLIGVVVLVPWLITPDRNTLADGSRVFPAPGTEYQILGYRKLHLSKGELRIQVKKIEGVPFTVRTPVGNVIAKGTEFVVKVSEERKEEKDMKVAKLMVTVMVMSGIVELVNPWGSQVAGPKECIYAQEGQSPQLVKEEGPWQELPEVDIDGRYEHSAILWGSKMVIWGGQGTDGPLCDGAILDLKEMRWEELPEPDIDGRRGHSTVLWGSKMVIWGGTADSALNDGAILDLEKMQWQELPESDLSGRYAHSAVLWGSKMVIWGGEDGKGNAFDDGAILDLEKMQWQELPESDIGGRYSHSAVLWGSKMVIWGGSDTFNDGAVLDLEKMKWEELPEFDICGRSHHSAVLWGSKMVIWGGIGPAWVDAAGRAVGLVSLSDGAILDLKTKEWEDLPDVDDDIDIDDSRFFSRYLHSTVLWDSKLVIWGGESSYSAGSYLQGAILDLKRMHWEELPEVDIDRRFGHSAVLWGSRMVIWGGKAPGLTGTGVFFDDGALLDLNKLDKAR